MFGRSRYSKRSTRMILVSLGLNYTDNDVVDKMVHGAEKAEIYQNICKNAANSLSNTNAGLKHVFNKSKISFDKSYRVRTFLGVS